MHFVGGEGHEFSAREYVSFISQCEYVNYPTPYRVLNLDLASITESWLREGSGDDILFC